MRHQYVDREIMTLADQVNYDSFTKFLELMIRLRVNGSITTHLFYMIFEETQDHE